MDKYIFTLLDPKGSEVDFRVGEFPSAEHALRLAELIAFDLSLDLQEQVVGLERQSSKSQRFGA